MIEYVITYTILAMILPIPIVMYWRYIQLLNTAAKEILEKLLGTNKKQHQTKEIIFAENKKVNKDGKRKTKE